jgi:short-chain Z-isoprenyl diphosphate synthase
MIEKLPRQVGIILDGNRRWARARGFSNVADGHRVGFAKIPEVLSWCDELGVGVVTLWMLSTDNIDKRPQAELAELYEIDEDITRVLAIGRRYRLRHLGRQDMLPAWLTAVLRHAEEHTQDVDGPLVNLAIAYGGRDELVDAVQELVWEIHASGDTKITLDRLAARLYTSGQPEVDLVIRTSGEHRTSGFMPWQSALAEWYFCDRHWPDFTRGDLLGAILAYGQRKRRLGA